MKDTLIFLNNLLKKDDIIVVATSGGPDSMCLLDVLNSLKETLNLKIICAHVNHGLRKESNEEALFVEKYCKENKIIFEYKILDNYMNNKFSEQEGREKRYRFFETLIKKYNAKYLMTAHHGDDLIETILMRLVRGSNLKGYAGIPRLLKGDKYQLVRPLLTLDKDEIYRYLADNNIEYVIDETNESEKYTRNRYRKHLLPFLKKEDNTVHLKFLKYSEELEKNNAYIKRVISKKIEDIYVENYIVINKLLEEDEYLQEKIIEYIIEDIQKKNILNINDKQFYSIMNLTRCAENKEITLADGFIARKSYNKLFIEKKVNSEKYCYIFENNLKILNKYQFNKISSSKEKSNNVIRINSEEITLPIIVRTKINGDKMQIKNLSGTKKLKDIFIDSKIDMQLRNEYPIVTDSKNIVLWIPGIKKSIFDKEINEKYDIIIKYTEEKNE